MELWPFLFIRQKPIPDAMHCLNINGVLWIVFEFLPQFRNHCRHVPIVVAFGHPNRFADFLRRQNDAGIFREVEQQPKLPPPQAHLVSGQRQPVPDRVDYQLAAVQDRGVRLGNIVVIIQGIAAQQRQRVRADGLLRKSTYPRRL